MTNHAGPIIAERDGLKVQACHVCGYAHLSPLPDQQDLDNYYRDVFWGPNGKGAGWLSRYEAEAEWNAAKNVDWLTAIEAHTRGRTLLDVGAGYGFFIDAAAQRGWKAVGIDPSAEASAYARAHGRDVRAVTWDDFWPSRYDAITAFWLLEHLPNALEFLKWTARHLQVGGVVCLAVPQEWTDEMDRASAVAAVKNWFIHPTHVNYFSAATLYGLLGRAGFRVVDALSTFPMAEYIVDGQDYTASESVGDVAHAWIRSDELEMMPEGRMGIARERARRNVGRDLIVVATLEE